MAEIYFGALRKTIGTGETFEVGVFADTGNDTVNAIGGTIAFDPADLIVEDIRDGNSFISFWVDRPAETAEGNVAFGGVIPGGYRGSDAYLFSLILRADEKGETTISATNEQMLLNDGQGTPAEITHAPLALTIVQESTGQAFVPPEDRDPPAPFTPIISRDETLFEGRWYAVFATQDKGSGIAGYDTQEQWFPFARAGAWEKTESPHPLEHQSRGAYLFVRAGDKAGNVRLATLPPMRPFFLYGILLLGLVACLIVWGVFKRRKK